MAESETQSPVGDNDGEAESESEKEYAWASQTPDTRIKGRPTSIVYAGRLDDTIAQNDTSFGVIIEEPEVVQGSLWENQAKPEGSTTADGVEDNEPRPTDYRIADTDDRDTTVANGALVTGEEGPNTYDESGGFEEDAVIVWYNGLTGQRLSRLLDFNGRPFARWTEDGYLVKGLYQPAEGWRNNPQERSRMAQNGKAPRVARAPLFRGRVDVSHGADGNIENVSVTTEDDFESTDVLIDVSRAASGRGYRLHAFDGEAFGDEFGDVSAQMPRNDGGYVKDDIESEMEMPYTNAADQILEEAGYQMNMHTGDGWQEEPEGWSPQSTSEVGTFGVSTDLGDGDEEGGLTAQEEQFIQEVVGEIKGSGLTPDEAFDGGLAGLIGKYADQFDRTPEETVIREEVFSRVGHLDPATLDE